MGTRKSRKVRGKDKGSGWFKSVIGRIYSEEQVMKDWKALEPAERIKTLASWVPKEMKIESDTTIQLVINGLRQSVPIDGTIRPALTAATVDDDQDGDES